MLRATDVVINSVAVNDYKTIDELIVYILGNSKFYYACMLMLHLPLTKSCLIRSCSNSYAMARSGLTLLNYYKI